MTAGLLVVSLTAGACGSDDDSAQPIATSTTEMPATPAPDDPADQEFPDVVGVEATPDGATWTFAVTISSPYDTPGRYADAWRVLGPDGEEYAIRELAHDHADEQPFTRSKSGIVVPDGVDVVTVQGRDLLNGWGGGTIDYELPR